MGRNTAGNIRLTMLNIYILKEETELPRLGPVLLPNNLHTYYEKQFTGRRGYLKITFTNPNLLPQSIFGYHTYLPKGTECIAAILFTDRLSKHGGTFCFFGMPTNIVYKSVLYETFHQYLYSWLEDIFCAKRL